MSSIKKIATVVLIITSLLAISYGAMGFGIGNPSGVRDVQAGFQAAREAESLLASGDDIIVHNDVVYDRDTLAQGIRVSRQQLWGQIIYLQVLPVFILALSIFLLFLLHSWFYRCGSCKKWLALKKVSTKRIGNLNTTRRLETGVTRSEYSGKVIAREYSDVAHTCSVYQVNYACKHCGSKKSKKKCGSLKRAY